MNTLVFLVALLCAAAFVAAVSAYEESDLDASVSAPKTRTIRRYAAKPIIPVTTALTQQRLLLARSYAHKKAANKRRKLAIQRLHRNRRNQRIHRRHQQELHALQRQRISRNRANHIRHQAAKRRQDRLRAIRNRQIHQAHVLALRRIKHQRRAGGRHRSG